MKKVFIIHGFEGTPNGGWRPYAMSKLEEHEIYACSLPMPTPDAPIIKQWLETIDYYVSNNQNDTIYLVGHSLGGTAILRYLEKYDCQNVKGIVVVSAPCELNNNQKILSFLEDKFDWSTIKNKVNSVVIHGDNDSYVPISDAQKIATELNAKLIIIPNGKHLNGSAGFNELPEVVSAILEIIS